MVGGVDAPSTVSRACVVRVAGMFIDRVSVYCISGEYFYRYIIYI